MTRSPTGPPISSSFAGPKTTTPARSSSVKTYSRESSQTTNLTRCTESCPRKRTGHVSPTSTLLGRCFCARIWTATTRAFLSREYSLMGQLTWHNSATKWRSSRLRRLATMSLGGFSSMWREFSQVRMKISITPSTRPLAAATWESYTRATRAESGSLRLTILWIVGRASFKHRRWLLWSEIRPISFVSQLKAKIFSRCRTDCNSLAITINIIQTGGTNGCQSKRTTSLSAISTFRSTLSIKSRSTSSDLRTCNRILHLSWPTSSRSLLVLIASKAQFLSAESTIFLPKFNLPTRQRLCRQKLIRKRTVWVTKNCSVLALPSQTIWTSSASSNQMDHSTSAIFRPRSAHRQTLTMECAPETWYHPCLNRKFLHSRSRMRLFSNRSVQATYLQIPDARVATHSSAKKSTLWLAETQGQSSRRSKLSRTSSTNQLATDDWYLTWSPVAVYF